MGMRLALRVEKVTATVSSHSNRPTTKMTSQGRGPWRTPRAGAG
ncbi:hypothetical protein [Streptomyces diastaticus]